MTLNGLGLNSSNVITPAFACKEKRHVRQKEEKSTLIDFIGDGFSFKVDELVFMWISLNPVDRTKAAYQSRRARFCCHVNIAKQY
jgi:hypothetical protein